MVCGNYLRGTTTRILLNSMKHLYLIRHGETDANKLRRHQNSDEKLNAKGRVQAHHVAHLLEGKKIDAILCSPYVRARETAEVISAQLQIPYATLESVVEIKRPDYIYGQRYLSFGTMMYMGRLFVHKENPNWRYDGAENMCMLRNRIEDAKHAIAKVDGEHIAVISHDVFMNFFLYYVCRDKSVTLSQFIKILLLTKKTSNATIIHLEYNPKAPKGVCAWQLIESSVHKR